MTTPPLFCAALIDPTITAQEDQEYAVSRYPVALVPQDMGSSHVTWRDDIRQYNPDIILLAYQMTIEETTVPGPGHNILRTVTDSWVTWSDGTVPTVGAVDKLRRVFDPRIQKWQDAYISACKATLDSYPYAGLFLDQCTIYDAASETDQDKAEMVVALQATITRLRQELPDVILVGNSALTWDGLNGEMVEGSRDTAVTEMAQVSGHVLPKYDLFLSRLSSDDDFAQVASDITLAHTYDAFYGASVNYQQILWFDSYNEILENYEYRGVSMTIRYEYMSAGAYIDGTDSESMENDINTDLGFGVRIADGSENKIISAEILGGSTYPLFVGSNADNIIFDSSIIKQKSASASMGYFYGNGGNPLTVKNSEITVDYNLTSNPVLNFGAGSVDLLIDNTRVDVNPESFSAVRYTAYIKDQTAPKIHNSIFTSLAEISNVTPIYLASSGIQSDNAEILGNTFLSHSEDGHIIRIGEESDGVSSGSISNTEISDNIMYGILNFNQESEGLNNAIFVGFNAAKEITRNKIVGSPYGIILIGNSTDLSGSKNLFNLVLNAKLAFRARGVVGTPSHHNTLVSTEIDVPTVKIVSNPDHSSPSTGTEMLNNIVWNQGAGACVEFDTASLTGSNFDYNVYISSNQTPFIIEDVNKSFTEWVAGISGDTHSIFIHENKGQWDIYLGSAPSVVDASLTYCPVNSVGRPINLDDNPIIVMNNWITGVNTEGCAGIDGKKVYGLPIPGSYQGVGVPRTSKKKVFNMRVNTFR